MGLWVGGWGFRIPLHVANLLCVSVTWVWLLQSMSSIHAAHPEMTLLPRWLAAKTIKPTTLEEKLSKLLKTFRPFCLFPSYW